MRVAERSERSVWGGEGGNRVHRCRAAPAGLGAGQHGTEKLPWAKKWPEYKIVKGTGEGK